MAIYPIKIPPEAVKGLEAPLPSFTDSAAWCAAPELPEDLAYELTKFLLENYKKFVEYSDVGKLISPKAMPFGWAPQEIHPGALKAYKEKGILK